MVVVGFCPLLRREWRRRWVSECLMKLFTSSSWLCQNRMGGGSCSMYVVQHVTEVMCCLECSAAQTFTTTQVCFSLTIQTFKRGDPSTQEVGSSNEMNNAREAVTHCRHYFYYLRRLSPFPSLCHLLRPSRLRRSRKRGGGAKPIPFNRVGIYQNFKLPIIYCEISKNIVPFWCLDLGLFFVKI